MAKLETGMGWASWELQAVYAGEGAYADGVALHVWANLGLCRRGWRSRGYFETRHMDNAMSLWQ